MLPHILYLCGYVSFVKTSYRKICYYLIILKIYYMYKYTRYKTDNRILQHFLFSIRCLYCKESFRNRIPIREEK